MSCSRTQSSDTGEAPGLESSTLPLNHCAPNESDWNALIKTSRTILAYKTWICLFSCLQEPIYNVLVIFFVLKLGVYVCLVKSLLIFSFYLSKQLKESSKTQNLEVNRR